MFRDAVKMVNASASTSTHAVSAVPSATPTVADIAAPRPLKRFALLVVEEEVSELLLILPSLSATISTGQLQTAHGSFPCAVRSLERTPKLSNNAPRPGAGFAPAAVAATAAAAVGLLVVAVVPAAQFKRMLLVAYSNQRRNLDVTAVIRTCAAVCPTHTGSIISKRPLV